MIKQTKQSSNQPEPLQPPAPESNLQPASPAGLVSLLLMAALMLLAAAVLLGSFSQNRRLRDIEREGFGIGDHATAISAETALQITDRLQARLQVTADYPVWPAQLASGRISLADYLLRNFIAPAYLRREITDEDFLADLHYVLTGREAQDEWQLAAGQVLTEQGSRLALINWGLEQAGFDSRIRLPAQTTRLRTVYVADNRPASGSELVGRLPIDSEIRLTGSQARLKLYVNDKIRSDLPLEEEDPTLMNRYSIEWDMDQEISGTYQLAILVLTNDGRGYWQNLESYRVPLVVPLIDYQLRTSRLEPDPDTANWYRIPAADGQVLLNLVQAEKPLQLELYDAYRNQLADTKSHPEFPTALRYRQPDSLDQNGPADWPFYYVKAASLTEEAESAFGYALLPAWTVATPIDQPERYLAVLAVREQQLLISDESGRQTWRSRADFQLYDPSARLIELELTGAAGQSFEFVPEFSVDTLTYALVVPAQVSALNLSWQTMEGSASAVTLNQKTSQGDIQPDTQLLQLSRSENQLSIQIEGFDGNEREYQVIVLRPPHDGPFDQVLASFPYSYQTWLWFTYLQQPSYQFVAQPTDISWQDFMTAQTYGSRSLVNADASPAHWVRPDSPVYDGVSWKAATDAVVAHFGDPRNFLDPVNIFQFESMVYEPEIHTRSGVEAILTDTFMEPGNPENIDYAGLLLQAGQEAEISPFFLASKIIQEMGRLGESPLAFGALQGYENAYNFYNINSIPNPEVPDGARINGARFALYGLNPEQGEISEREASWLIPWNTPERAIVGGAIWIAERYVSIGQDTLYLQKFDLVGVNGLFMRQYAQNIQMAWAEGRRTYRAYSDMALLDQPFHFKIPIFQEMTEIPAPWP